MPKLSKPQKQKYKPVSETTLNRFLDQVEKKYIGSNPFKRFISIYKFNKFCKETMKSSPSLGVLWYFADFVKLAERIYFYDNSQSSPIYSSDNYSYGENGFIITNTDNAIKITVKLNSDEQKTAIEIKRLNGTKKSTEFSFYNNSWGERDNYDEVLIDNIIGIINSHIVALLKYCWNKKGMYDDFNLILN